MKHILEEVFHSGKFVVGFSIFLALLLIVVFYPLFIPDDPLGIIAQGTFFPPASCKRYDSIIPPYYIIFE